jgi:transcriptional regulator with XRE-family HTH domain
MSPRDDELSEFLVAKRSALDPVALGVAGSGSPRRVAGLRREELAALAGVSVDYYTRLEQGRPITPSESVLDALAAALQLDSAELTYLRTIVHRWPSRRARTPRRQTVRPGLRSILEALGDTPAFVLGRRTDILATNRMARALLADFDAMPARERNATRWLTLDEAARSLFGAKWVTIASEFVGALRMDAARHPDDPRTAELVASSRSRASSSGAGGRHRRSSSTAMRTRCCTIRWSAS